MLWKYFLSVGQKVPSFHIDSYLPKYNPKLFILNHILFIILLQLNLSFFHTLLACL